jgi:hypothetical protein
MRSDVNSMFAISVFLFRTFQIKYEKMSCTNFLNLEVVGVSEDYGLDEFCALSYSTLCLVPGGIFILEWCSMVRNVLGHLAACVLFTPRLKHKTEILNILCKK